MQHPKQAGSARHKNPQDEAANPGDVLCILNTGEADSPEPAPPDQAETATPAGDGKLSQRDRMSPAVRQRVAEHQLDLEGIAGSGRDGRITLQDVEALIAGQQTVASKETTPPAVKATSASAAGTEGSDIIPHDRMRKRIADNMVASLMHTAPHVTAVFEADLSAVLKHRSLQQGNVCQERYAADPDRLLRRRRHRRHKEGAAGQ